MECHAEEQNNGGAELWRKKSLTVSRAHCLLPVLPSKRGHIHSHLSGYMPSVALLQVSSWILRAVWLHTTQFNKALAKYCSGVRTCEFHRPHEEIWAQKEMKGYSPMVPTWNCNTQEAEAGGSQVQGLHTKALSQNQRKTQVWSKSQN